MKGGTVQISWHGSDPILSVDFHSTSGLLATAGADRDIKLWSLHHVEKSKALPTPTFKANLSYHSSAVNVIRFSPDGELLASGADGGELVIWRLVQVGEESPSWKVWKTLRFHLKDVLDLEWSMDGASLVSGSVDNTCIIWDVTRGTVQQVLSDHQHYVQGVAWDPALEYVVSLSGDRTCRFYSTRSSTKKTKGKERKEDKDRNIFECKHVLFKKDAAANPCSKADERSVAASKQYLFYDENMPSFFRRLSWSPDGSFLVVPSGVEKHSPEAAPSSLAYVVLREELSKPSPQPTIQLPAGSKPVMGVRFCPVIFTLRSKEHWKHDTTAPFVSPFNLPYRLIFAVATLTCVYIYDTQVSCPIAVLSGLHFAPITDLAWSPDGKFLAVSSQDGYCTLAGFDTGELGLPVSREVCKIEDILGSLAPSSPGQASLMDANTCIEVPKVEKSMKQRADSAVKVKRAKLRRITPKVIPITDFLEALPVGGSRASSSSVVTNSVKSQTHACDENSLKDNLQQQSTDANGKPLVAESNAACIEQITSANDLEQLDVGSATCSTPSSASVLPLLPAEETSCTNILTSSAKAPGSSCAQIQMESSGLAEFRKPQDEFAHLYVRPLKGRRITPKPVTDDQCPVTSKPIC